MIEDAKYHKCSINEFEDFNLDNLDDYTNDNSNTKKIYGTGQIRKGLKDGYWELIYYDFSDLEFSEFNFTNEYDKLKATGYYNNNQKDGIWRYTYHNQLVAIGRYESGYLHGVWSFYKENKPYKFISYQFGVRNGISKYFTSIYVSNNVSQRIEITVPFVNNLKEGLLEIRIDHDKKLLISTNYTNDKKNGVCKFIDNISQIHYLQHFKNDVLSHEEFSNDGEFNFDYLNICYVGFVYNKMKTGRWIELNNEYVETFEYFEGIKNGEYCYYHINNLLEIGNYLNGLKNGEWREYNFPPDYTLQFIKNYNLGKKHGNFEEYDSEQKLITSQTFDNDKLISYKNFSE